MIEKSIGFGLSVVTKAGAGTARWSVPLPTLPVFWGDNGHVPEPGPLT